MYMVQTDTVQETTLYMSAIYTCEQLLISGLIENNDRAQMYNPFHIGYY